MAINHPKPPDIKALIQRLGGPVAVAKALDITHGAVCQWTRVPVHHVPKLVALSRKNKRPVSAKTMRPDVPWGALRRMT